MPIKQRSVLTTQNTTLDTNKDTAFPDNNNKEITAAILRTWLDELISQVQDIIDSYFNQLDELRITSTLTYDIVATPTDWNGGTAPATQNLVNDELADRIKTIEGEGFQTAFETPYSPTTPLNWGAIVPSEVRGGLDILAQKTLNNASDNIAFVSTTGSDTINEFEIGNPLKPFLTIQAAINAVPSNNSKVIVLGGNYTEDIVISSGLANSKTNFVLDLRGVTFNTIDAVNGFVVSNCTNFTILLNGGIINGYVNLGGSSKASIEGGKIENLLTAFPCLNLGSGSEVIGVTMQNSGTQTLSCTNQVLEIRPFVSKCRISTNSVTSNHATIFRARTILFETCYIEGPIALSTENSADYCTLINCTLVSTISTTLKGENLVLNAVLKNCTIKSLATNQDTVSMSLNSINTRFYNCNFIAQRHCIDISAGIARLGDNTIFQDCNFFCDQDGISGGKVLNDAANTDTGSTEFINCVYNDTWSTNAANAFDNNGLLKIGLLPPPL